MMMMVGQILHVKQLVKVGCELQTHIFTGSRTGQGRLEKPEVEDVMCSAQVVLKWRFWAQLNRVMISLKHLDTQMTSSHDQMTSEFWSPSSISRAVRTGQLLRCLRTPDFDSSDRTLNQIQFLVITASIQTKSFECSQNPG